MAGDFLKLVSGVPTDTLALTASAGAGDAGRVPKLDSGGKLDASMMPTGIGAETRTVQASENLAAGDLVNFHFATGPRMRKADATTPGKKAHGFVLTSVTSGTSGTVYPEQAVITGLTGITTGAEQFLATTAGGRTESSPTAAGQVSQSVGFGISTTEVLFSMGTAYTLA